MTTVIAALLAGCGTTTSSQLPNVAFPSVARAPRATSPCDVSGYWYFKGSCLASTVARTGGTYKLQPYADISLTVKFGKTTASGKRPLVIGDAIGLGDVTGTYQNIPFPKYSKATCEPNHKCVGSPYYYWQVISSNKKTIGLIGQSTYTISTGSNSNFPGKNCLIAVLNPDGWLPNDPVPVSGKTLSISFPRKSLVLPFPQPLVMVLVCK